MYEHKCYSRIIDCPSPTIPCLLLPKVPANLALEYPILPCTTYSITPLLSVSCSPLSFSSPSLSLCHRGLLLSLFFSTSPLLNVNLPFGLPLLSSVFPLPPLHTHLTPLVPPFLLFGPPPSPLLLPLTHKAFAPAVVLCFTLLASCPPAVQAYRLFRKRTSTRMPV